MCSGNSEALGEVKSPLTSSSEGKGGDTGPPHWEGWGRLVLWGHRGKLLMGTLGGPPSSHYLLLQLNQIQQYGLPYAGPSVSRYVRGTWRHKEFGIVVGEEKMERCERQTLPPSQLICWLELWRCTRTISKAGYMQIRETRIQAGWQTMSREKAEKPRAV